MCHGLDLSIWNLVFGLAKLIGDSSSDISAKLGRCGRKEWYVKLAQFTWFLFLYNKKIEMNNDRATPGNQSASIVINTYQFRMFSIL